MKFALSEEQAALVDSTRKLIARNYDFAQRAAIARSETGRSPATWSAFAEIGLLALPFDESLGGFGFGAGGLMPVMQELGDGLVLEPFVSALLCGRLIASSIGVAQQQAHLPGILDGSAVLAFAHQEKGARWPLARVETRAVPMEGGYVLDGAKVLVEDASCADKLLVLARQSGAPDDPRGLGLYVVDAKAHGVEMRPYRGIDDRRGADVSFKGVRVDAGAQLAGANDTFGIVEEGIDFATALICCEAVGVMQSVNTMTIEYLKARRQFGVPIGSFQALQHRLTDMASATEQAYSISLYACAKVDAALRSEAGVVERRKAVSAAKIKVADAARLVGQSAVQLHGGMGLAEEMKVSHAFKRLTVIERQFGDVHWHLARFASAARGKDAA